MFETEPPADWALAQLPQVVATPHIAASTEEAQELVGIDTAAAVRDFLRDGIVRNAVNFPSIHPDELQRLQPWIRLADQLGALASQMGTARIEALGVRYYGALAESRGVDILAASAAAGVLRPILSSGVSIVNARAAARERGIDIVESRSSRARHFTSLVSIKLHTDAGERWVEGTVFEPNSPRLVSVRGVDVEAPLGGTMLIIANDDQPGVIGEVGTILGRHGVNIANFALGRGDDGAIGVVNVDEDTEATLAGRLSRIRKVRQGSCVKLTTIRRSVDWGSRNLIHRPRSGARQDGCAPAAASRQPPARRRRDTSSADPLRSSPRESAGSCIRGPAATVPLNSRGICHSVARRIAPPSPRGPARLIHARARRDAGLSSCAECTVTRSLDAPSRRRQS